MAPKELHLLVFISLGNRFPLCESYTWWLTSNEYDKSDGMAIILLHTFLDQMKGFFLWGGPSGKKLMPEANSQLFQKACEWTERWILFQSSFNWSG